MTPARDFEGAVDIEWGSSPRGSIGMFIGAKANALMKGRNYVIAQDIKDIAHPVLRHRIILGYAAKTKKLDSDKIIKNILKKVPAP